MRATAADSYSRPGNGNLVKRSMIVLAVVSGMAFAAPAAWAATESLVTQSPSSPFPQNKQNEPGLAINPIAHSVAAAGSNEELDLAPCDGSDCRGSATPT